MPTGVYLHKTGYKHSVETRAKIGAANKGHKHSVETRAQIGIKSTIHGLSRHPMYIAYKQMMYRCYNPDYYDYFRYGAKEVTVWEPWHDVRTFIFGILALLGERPKGYTIDRINPHEGYFPWNVRWADLKTQRANQRKNVLDYHSQCGEH